MGRAGLQALMSKATSSFRPRKKDSTSTSLSSSHGGPYNQTLRLLSIIFLIFLLFLSTAALILKANTFSFIEMNREMGFFLEMPEFEGDPEKQPLVAALPLRLYRVSEKIILIMSGLNILLSMGHLGLIAINWKTAQRTQTSTVRRNSMTLHILNACMLLIAMTSIFLTNATSSRFRVQDIPEQPNAVSPTGFRYFRYDVGTFDLETWSCELKDAPPIGMAREDYSKQCMIEAAGKIIMVPFFVMALAIAGVSIWGFISMGKTPMGNDQPWTKDMEIEMGKFDADDKGFRVEEVEVEAADTAPRLKDGRLSKIEEDEMEESEDPPIKGEAGSKDVDDKSKPASDGKHDPASNKPDATS